MERCAGLLPCRFNPDDQQAHSLLRTLVISVNKSEADQGEVSCSDPQKVPGMHKVLKQMWRD